jgi:hypothetical protein
MMSIVLLKVAIYPIILGVIILIGTIKPIMLSVIILNVVILKVAAPLHETMLSVILG